MKIILFILILSISSHAEEKKTFCKPGKELFKQVESCEQNEYYAEAGVLCLKKLESAIEEAAKDMKLSAGSAKNQAKNIHNSLVNYNLSVAALDQLIHMAEERAQESKNYFRDIVYPEDIDSPIVQPAEVGKFLAGSSCYKDTVEVLYAVEQDFREHIKELKAARDIAMSNSKTAGHSEQNLNATSAAANTNNMQSSKKAPQINGRPSANKSSISDSSLKKNK